MFVCVWCVSVSGSVDDVVQVSCVRDDGGTRDETEWCKGGRVEG